jgi:hypothetical protein
MRNVRLAKSGGSRFETWWLNIEGGGGIKLYQQTLDLVIGVPRTGWEDGWIHAFVGLRYQERVLIYGGFNLDRICKC